MSEDLTIHVQKRVDHVERVVDQVKTDVGRLSSEVNHISSQLTALTSSVKDLATVVTAGTKTNWHTVATGVSVVTALLATYVSLTIAPVNAKIDSISGKQTEVITTLNRNVERLNTLDARQESFSEEVNTKIYYLEKLLDHKISEVKTWPQPGK